NFNINFTEFNIYSGSSTGTHVDANLYGHMQFMGSPGINGAPTISGNILDFSSPNNCHAVVSFPNNFTLTSGTIMAIAQIVGNPSYVGFFSNVADWTQYTLGEQQGAPFGFAARGYDMGVVTNKGLNFVIHGTRFDGSSSDRITAVSNVVIP